ncbi:hypothetical protein GGR55DRAFT_574244 [Xylaria sp. FL0064]|nr:hypothetical protein GGR55DRAFT_574244 [Xylaria sp. FL0064]
MTFNLTPYKSRPPPGQQGSTPFRSSSASKFRSSLVPTSRPSPVRSPKPSSKPTKPTTTSAGGRDLFRTSTPRPQRTAEFAPDLPAEVTRLPASVRKLAPRKTASSGMSNTGSTEPFAMRIPSPDPDLTGQALAKAVPDDPTRTGSIYADQFLAHKCPSHFDELQRRQFFCILDLRRLKYAADEIFIKKDWKLNILNFAKEYEKSRGLIMLRYGLYEFKNVKPSSEVLKKWRTAHGLAPETGDDSVSSPNRSRADAAGSTKRKAEEELTPRGNASTTSAASQNKRVNLAQETDDPSLSKPAPFKTAKRKADESEEVDENKPKKQLKPTPSAAASLFESIINKPRNGGPSPSKQTSQPSSLFDISKSKDSQDSKFATKANDVGSPAGSVLAGHNAESKPNNNTGNIFSYLSGSSTNSSEDENDNADDDESDSGAEPDSEEQDASAAVSTGTSTPPVQNGSLFNAGQKTSQTSNIFGGVSKSADEAPKGGLFGRVQMGANGQPVRANPLQDEGQERPLNQISTPDQQQTKTPAKQPGNYTFNPATTPISFGQPIPDVSKSFSATAPAASAEPVSSSPKKPASIFGASSQPNSGVSVSATSVSAPQGSTKSQSSEPVSFFATQKKPAPTSTSIFGAPSSAVKSPFGGDKAPASTGLFGVTPPTSTAKGALGGEEALASKSIFGATPPGPSTKRSFGGDEHTSEAQSANKKQGVSTFATPTTTASTAEAKPLDNKADDKAASSTMAAKDQKPSIFDQSFIAKSAAQNKGLSDSLKTSSDLFSRSLNPLFAAPKDDKGASTEASTKDQKPSIFDKSFIAASAAQNKALSESMKTSSDLFSRSANPLFGAQKTNGTSDDTKAMVNQVKEQPSADSTPSNEKLQVPNDSNKENVGSALGSKTLAPVPKTASIFGTQGASTLAAPSSTLFGAQKQQEPTNPASSISSSAPAANSSIFSFGSQPNSNSNTQSTSMTFGAGAGAGATPSPAVSFGASSSQPNDNKVGFQFGSPAPSASSSSFTFGQTSSSASGFTFTAGADKQKVNNTFAGPQPGSQPSAPLFGGNSTTTTPSSSFNFNFGQQPSSTPKAPVPSQNGSIFGSSTKMNGALNFGFTQASPGQNSQAPKSSALMNSSGHLQASGDGSTRANSPFPAPSSMGTTPVNGTPEPQAPNEDGEEARHEQISLTEGGPGEEDETLLHEVRAKAIKYIPVQKGDEDQEKEKSPWSTRGVGPLRVLKNKSTGAVRILLRAEPRGHVALNKTILPDVEYKPKLKTLNFVTADDNGSGLETWVLQVKSAALATELAGVLEANKIANKK